MSNSDFHIVSHTHWDREWYETFETFRHYLVSMLDYLLDSLPSFPGFRFNLDCQTIVLEDYLAIRPERRPELESAIRNGNLQVGPWYMQNDFFSSGGETTIRSLLHGMHLSRTFGYAGDFDGYAPDQMGHISQLPQIFQGVGIGTLIFGRGRESEKCDLKNTFWFEGLDGSRLFAFHMMNFYNNAQRFSTDENKAWRYFEMVRKKEEPVSITNNYLLMNGVDHLFPQMDLEESLKAIRKHLADGDTIHQSTLHEFMAAQRKSLEDKKLEVHHGELANCSNERLLLRGTFSSRIAQKSALTAAENRLYVQLQGLCAMLVLCGFSRKEYDDDQLEYLWKLLAECLAHDSSWGCSKDAVHRHISDRLERFNELADAIVLEKMTLLSQHTVAEAAGAGDYRITVVNTLPCPVKTTAKAIVDISLEDERGALELKDGQGRNCPVHVASSERTERALRSPVNLPGRRDVMRREITFPVELPAFGYAVYTVTPCTEDRLASSKPLGDSNGLIAVTVHPDGRIDLNDLARRRIYRDCLWLEDAGDLGDAYSWKPAPPDQDVSTRGMTPKAIRKNTDAEQTSWTLDYVLELPERAVAGRTRRSRQTRKMPLQITLTMSSGCPWLSVDIQGDNTVDDHFLRAIVHTGCRNQDFSQSTGIFEIARRDRRELERRGWHDREDMVRDMLRVKTAQDGGLAILTGNLHSFGHLPDNDERHGAVALGLLRGNGYILGYYETPRDNTWVAPENQQHGPFRRSFSIMPATDDDLPVQECRMAQQFCNPPLTFSDSCNPAVFSGGRPCVQDTSVTEIFSLPDSYANMTQLPSSASFFSIDSNSPMLHSTVKAAGNVPDGFIIRLWNADTRETKCKMHIPSGWSAAETNLAEEHLRDISVSSEGTIKVTVPKARILTLLVRP